MSAMTLHYDEFGMFAENAAEAGLPYSHPPIVTRRSVDRRRRPRGERAAVGQRLADHRAACTAVRRTRTPGTRCASRSGGRSSRSIFPGTAIPITATTTGTGRPRTRRRSRSRSARSRPSRASSSACRSAGSAAIALAARAPDLVPSLVLVDVTPGVDEVKADAIVQFVNGPESFASFDEILERTIQFNPTRSVSSLRRGVMHNAMPTPDGHLALALRPPALRREPAAELGAAVGRHRRATAARSRSCAAASRRS